MLRNIVPFSLQNKKVEQSYEKNFILPNFFYYFSKKSFYRLYFFLTANHRCISRVENKP